MSEPLSLASTPMVASLPAKCNLCRANADPFYKTCTACRRKRTAYHKQRNERVKMTQILAVKKGDAPTGKNVAGLQAPELKWKSIGDANSTMERRKKRVKYSNIKEARKQIMGRDPMVFGTEFQTAAEMYKRLKSLLRKNARLNYQACHSIVADPECSHGKRATLVARDIQKAADVSFNHKVTITAPLQSRTFYTLRFRCTCAYCSPAQRDELPVMNQVNVSGGDTMENLPSCQGEVEVTVMEDLRHPLGIVGQQIRIQIRH
ncbi:uncharacterized protein C8R40DRAFT_1073461 [Lentinula edodes]|uniref:uncharacterized protein n=1 Tax=Lentinula edodes TaxID=5353 RepID=UPI001E8CFEF8|nr:uncharacterized protein C8R40DRAFT_1073461 [Lentinula edodes]KAH7870199.1 hypothetical protein C8R40DRAFT_1073461 [Lentinula edodes]